MNEQLPLFERLKQARAVQILVVYLGASWVVLQLVGTLRDLMTLPDWIGPVTLILLGIGLVVVMATAWVQSLEATTRAEEAGEVPTDWEVDAADVVASLKSGKLPHLTWGRAILGGVVALSLAIGAAGAFVLVTGGQGLIGPAEAGASSVAEGIAVLPFDARGDDLAIYREGMVDLLSASFDGIGGYRTIDSRTVLARWSEEVGDVVSPDLRVALRAAGRTGARYAVLGSMVPAGRVVRVDVDLFDVGDGRNIGSVRVDGSPEDVIALVDALTVAIARELLGSAGAEAATERHLANITTTSVPALREYLEGERLYRLGNFDDAVGAFEAAVATDSTFALAWARLAASAGWSGAFADRSVPARATAARMLDRLSAREATLVQARNYYNRGEPEAISLLEEYTRRYPDDSEAWYDLGDSYFHMHIDMQGAIVSRRDQALSALSRAAELDPTFAPYQIHLVDFAFAAGDSAAAAEAIAQYEANGGAQNPFSATWPVGMKLLFGDDAAAQEALSEALALAQPEFALGLLGAGKGTLVPRRELMLRREVARTHGRSDLLTQALTRAGRMDELDEVLSSTGFRAALGFRLMIRALYGVGDSVGVHEGVAAFDCPGGERACLERSNVLIVHGALDGHPAELASGVEALSAAVESAQAQFAGPANSAAFMPRLISALGVDARAAARLFQDDAQGAYALWSEAGDAHIDHFWAAVAAEAVGDFATAERYYLGASWRNHPAAASYRLAKMYEGLARPADALAQYQRLARLWSIADDDFQPWIEVQEALARLGG